MANVQGLWRTGIFKVRDLDAFTAELEKYEDAAIGIRPQGGNEVLLVDEDTCGCIPEFYNVEYADPAIEDDLIPWADIFKEHLEPGNAVVFFAASYCKEASLFAEAVVYDSDGRHDYCSLYDALSMMNPLMTFRYPEETSREDNRFADGPQPGHSMGGINTAFQVRQSKAVQELLKAVRFDFGSDKTTLVENCCIAARVTTVSTGTLLHEMVDYLERDILENPEPGKAFNGYSIVSYNRKYLVYAIDGYTKHSTPQKWKAKLWDNLT